MASVVPAKKNQAYVFYVGLASQADPRLFQVNPSLSAGDVKIAIDDGAPANLATIPAFDADFTKRVKVSLSADEMNGDNITIIFSDAAGAEWCDLIVNIQTVANQIDDLDTVIDTVKTDSTAILLDTGTDGVVVAAASKAGYALSAAGIQAIWDALTSALTTVGSIGKKLADWITGTIDTYTGNTKQTGDNFVRLGAPAGASVSADIAAVKTDTDNLVTRITATLFSGITSLAQWLGLMAGKQVGNATARTEVRATGAGAGTFDETTDSEEAIRDTAPLGTAMRGTDNAALASICTETRLAELDAANLPADIDGIKAKTVLLPDGVTKNTALANFMFLMNSSDDHVTPKTGLTITAQRSIDGAAFAACANAATEVGSGIYKINLAATDLNGDIICLKFTAMSADTRFVVIKTET